MSVKKESSGRRSIQVEVEVPGTPEEVWRAIATGQGISSWFVPTQLEEREGGKMLMNFGPGMDATATITKWNPPLEFAAESSHLGENAPPVATEWFVEARGGGVCIVRVVHSLFSDSDQWDGELEGTESGWPTYFRVLRLYLGRFAGMYGGSMIAMGSSADSESATWEKIIENLNLHSIKTGQPCNTGSGAPRLSGVVESHSKQSPHFLIMALNEPVSGIALIGANNCGGQVLVSASLYLYGNKAADIIPKQQEAWQTWMNEHFPAPAPKE
jgi:uncharacterized protein YndB with AHSA1/START domain